MQPKTELSNAMQSIKELVIGVAVCGRKAALPEYCPPASLHCPKVPNTAVPLLTFPQPTINCKDKAIKEE